MSQFLNLINSVGKGTNLPLLSSLAEPIQEQIKDSIGGSLDNLKNAGEAITDNVSDIIEQKAPVLSDSMSSVSVLYRWRNAIVIFLILWAIFMILSRIFIKDEDVKDHIEKTSFLLIGSQGIIYLIGVIWFGTLIMVSMVPAMIAIAPKVESVLGTVNSAIGTLANTLKK